MQKTQGKLAAGPARAAASAPQTPSRSAAGPRAVGSFVPRLTREAFEKFGFSAATILTDWAVIVGPELARSTSPERLKWPKGVTAHGEAPEHGERGRPGATLVLRADNGRALDIQYKARQIIERINAYFGYRAVVEIRIVQAPIAPTAADALPRPRAVIRAGKPATIPAMPDEGLRSALERMATGLSMRRSAAAE